MDLVNLQASPRVASKGQTHALRRQGFLPVVLYGHGVPSRPLKVRQKDFERLLETGAGRNSLIRLVIEGETSSEPPTVIIKDIQSDYIRGRYIHADFQQVSLKEKIRAKVRVVLHGEDAVAKEGGIVQHQMREVEVECLPTALPEHITFDLTGMGIGDTVTLGDLKVPSGVELLGEPEAVVASIVAPKQGAEEAPAAAEAQAEGQAAGAGAAAPAGGKPAEDEKKGKAGA